MLMPVPFHSPLCSFTKKSSSTPRAIPIALNKWSARLWVVVQW